MKQVYIASPYSYKSKIPGLSLLVQYIRYSQITKIAGKLHDIYPDIAFILPITQSHHIAKYMKSNSTTFKAWAARDLEFISRCDEIWVIKMPGWNQSIGVMAEIDFALEIELPIKYINLNNLDSFTVNTKQLSKLCTSLDDYKF